MQGFFQLSCQQKLQTRCIYGVMHLSLIKCCPIPSRSSNYWIGFIKAFQIVSETQELLKKYIIDFDPNQKDLNNFAIWATIKRRKF